MNLRTIRKRGLALLLAGVMTVGLAPAALATDGTPLESGLLTEPFLQVPGVEKSLKIIFSARWARTTRSPAWWRGTAAPSMR